MKEKEKKNTMWEIFNASETKFWGNERGEHYRNLVEDLLKP